MQSRSCAVSCAPTRTSLAIPARPSVLSLLSLVLLTWAIAGCAIEKPVRLKLDEGLFELTAGPVQGRFQGKGIVYESGILKADERAATMGEHLLVAPEAPSSPAPSPCSPSPAPSTGPTKPDSLPSSSSDPSSLVSSPSPTPTESPLMETGKRAAARAGGTRVSARAAPGRAHPSSRSSSLHRAPDDQVLAEDLGNRAPCFPWRNRTSC